MTQQELSVDPNGVIQTGSAYTAAGQILRAYQRQLDELRSTYYDSWGDDGLGQQFSQKFLDGLDTLERLVTGVADSLDFGGEGLTTGGKAYQYAEDEATEAGDKLYEALAPLGQQPPQAATALLRQEEQPRRDMQALQCLAPSAKPNDPIKAPEISISGRKDPETGRDEKLVTIDGQEFQLRPVDTPEGDELITRDGAIRLVAAVYPETGERVYQKISFDGQAYEIEPVDGEARRLRPR
jgi:hypothetical protein